MRDPASRASVTWNFENSGNVENSVNFESSVNFENFETFEKFGNFEHFENFENVGTEHFKLTSNAANNESIQSSSCEQL